MRFFPRKSTSQRSDEELLEEYRSGGDKALVGILYTRYAHLVFGLCLNYFRDKELARDAVLQLFERLFDSLRRTKPENFKTWLTYVARNYCISELRKQQVQRERSAQFHQDELSFSPESTDELAEGLHEKEEKLKRLELAVRELGEEQRICIELFYFKDQSYREIAETTGYSENQVKSYIQNGKRNLKLLMEDPS
jgi:RNA polymerase sigma-70 factor (ECF subfamily)